MAFEADSAGPIKHWKLFDLERSKSSHALLVNILDGPYLVNSPGEHCATMSLRVGKEKQTNRFLRLSIVGEQREF